MLLCWVVYDDGTYALIMAPQFPNGNTLLLSKSGSARNNAISDS